MHIEKDTSKPQSDKIPLASFKSLLRLKMKRFVVEVVTIACVASLSSASESNAVEDIFKIRRDRVKSVCSKYDDPLKYGYSALHKVLLTHLSTIIFRIFYGNPNVLVGT